MTDLKQIIEEYGLDPVEVKRVRNVTIEECARAVENRAAPGHWPANPEIAAAIRALKDKP